MGGAANGGGARAATTALRLVRPPADPPTDDPPDLWSAGPILHAVQMSGLFEDCKTFVDMPLLTSPSVATAAFASLPVEPSTGLPSLPDLRAFVAAHFGPPGSDYVPTTPPDHSPTPPPGFLPRVRDPAVRDGAARVHALWPALCRRAAVEPCAPGSGPGTSSNRTSTLLTTPGWAVVPGDRFRESYFWDAHWTVRGLLASGCSATATAVVSTLVALARASPDGASVPNGARTYYTNRSQPPLLAPTAALLWGASGDPAARDLALAVLPALRAERAAWDAPHRVAVVEVGGGGGGGGGRHALARYCARWARPRPEAYREDVASAVAAGALAPGPDAAAVDAAGAAAADLWRGLASAAESGWDFSDRWCAGGVPVGVVAGVAGHPPAPSPRCAAAHRVLPADLNAFLARSDDALALLCAAAGDAAGAAAHAAAADARRAAIDAVLWDEGAGRWCDAVLPPPGSAPPAVVRRAPGTYASCWVPLWAGCGRGASPPLWPAAVASLAASGLVGAGGLATSPGPGSGEQWDGPNAWPPLQALVAEGLAGVSGEGGEADPAAARAAAGLAEAIVAGFVGTALAGLAAEGVVREKYSAARSDGVAGSGGEYDAQVGFGWTNGTVLALLRRFGWPPTAAAAREAGEGGD